MIEIEAVTKVFRRTRVLDALSLKIEDGDRIALIGSNGAGKTTLIRCLLGEYTHGGSIRVNGKEPRSDRHAVLGDIGFVPQLPPPLKMPVRDLVRFAAAVCDGDRAEIGRIAEALGLDLEEIGSRPFFKLSGGQKQKILVAIALGRPVRMLILDEPTANLDPAARRVLFGLLAERADIPMIISSHRLDEISGLVNRVVEVDRGRVVLDDRVEDAGDASAVQECRLVAARSDTAFARAIAEWGFSGSEDDRVWRGEVAGPDRMRFLGMLARYAGLLADIELVDKARSSGGSPGAGETVN
ncbi:MAG: ABC transporter ATP-binding protein [Hyphomicrobiales bacterium]